MTAKLSLGQLPIDRIWAIAQNGFAMKTDELLSLIEDHCAKNGVSPATFGLRAVNDGKLVPRLKGGGQCLPSTQEKILRHLDVSATGDAA